MNFYYFDIIQFVVFGFALFGVWKAHKTKKALWLLPIAFVVLAFMFSPVNITQKNASARFVTDRHIPEKHSVPKKDFNQSQAERLERLENQSEEKKDETVN